MEALHARLAIPGAVREPTLHAARIVLDTVWRWQNFPCARPLLHRFTANAAMALNTVLNGVLHPGDHVIHNGMRA